MSLKEILPILCLDCAAQVCCVPMAGKNMKCGQPLIVHWELQEQKIIGNPLQHKRASEERDGHWSHWGQKDQFRLESQSQSSHIYTNAKNVSINSNTRLFHLSHTLTNKITIKTDAILKNIIYISISTRITSCTQLLDCLHSKSDTSSKSEGVGL